MVSSEQLWLTDAEQHAWRAYLRASRHLEVRLDTELQSVGLSFPEYEVMAMLSEAPNGTMRMSALADLIVQSRSRLTHTAGRLERRSWVTRTMSPDDRRGVLIALTPSGAETVRRAAVVHVQGVRKHFIDPIGPGDLAAVGEGMDRVRRHVTGHNNDLR